MNQRISSLQKSLELIEELSRDGADVGVSDLARRLGLTKNQVYRILKTLQDYGYVRQLDGKTYALGYKFVSIGHQLLGHLEIAEIAAPIMDQLRDCTGESVHLAVRDGFRAVCIAKRDSQAALRMSAQIGAWFLPHAGACPKAIGAFQSPDVIDAAIDQHGLPQYTAYTVSSREALETEFATIRNAGFAESQEDIDLHVYSVAVPIFDRDGSVNAAMSVAGPVQRFDGSKRTRALRHLARACEQISLALGAPIHSRPRIRGTQDQHQRLRRQAVR